MYPLKPGVSRGPPGLSGGPGPLGPPHNSTTGGGLEGASEKIFLGSLSLAIFYGPLVNYSIIRPLLVTWTAEAADLSYCELLGADEMVKLTVVLLPSFTLLSSTFSGFDLFAIFSHYSPTPFSHFCQLCEGSTRCTHRTQQQSLSV